MKKLSSTDIQSLLEEFQGKFRSTQKRISIPIIFRISSKMQIGIQFAAIKIFEDLIIDGHHRYIASIISKTKISQIYTLKPTTIHVYPWEEIEFVDEDWDTPEKIIQLNKSDAWFNNMSFEEITKLLK